MNESNKFPSEDWKAGYKCAIDCYTFVIKELLYELSAKKKKFSQAMITDVAMIMMQHRMDIHDEYIIQMRLLMWIRHLSGLDGIYQAKTLRVWNGINLKHLTLFITPLFVRILA